MHVGLKHKTDLMLLIERLGARELSKEEPAVLKLQHVVVLLTEVPQ